MPTRKFIRAVGASLHDRLVRIISSFPEFDALPPFYRDLADALCGIEKIRMSLGALGWAAKQSRRLGSLLGREARASGIPPRSGNGPLPGSRLSSTRWTGTSGF